MLNTFGRMAAFFGTLLFGTLSIHSADWNFANTRGVVVGVLQWKDKGLSPFSDKLRKDKELHGLLLKRGIKPAALPLLIDSQATKANIEKAIRDAAQGADAGSVFYFYYAGHGVKGGNEAYVANYDIQTSNNAATGLSIKRLAQLIAENFKGNTVIFTGDFCYSGAFQDALKIITAKGKQGFVLASSTASNASTGNWTFTQTWIECLSGSPYCDRNGDGTITLSETNGEIGEAMKYRERQRNGFVATGVDGNLVLATATGRKAPGTGNYLLAPYKGNLQPARILGRTGNSIRVEFFFYSEKKSQVIPDTSAKPFQFREVPAGTGIRVLWNGKAYDAKVLKQEEGFHYITYPGYGAEWNEWVMDDRIITDDTVLAEWKGKWYPARVLKKDGNKSFVHYEGFGDEWNEWLPPARIKKP